MKLLKRDLDNHPYTGKREVHGYLKCKEKGTWIDDYFNGNTNYVQVKNITQGKQYKVVAIEGMGDVEDVSIIDDVGEIQSLGSFFFE